MFNCMIDRVWQLCIFLDANVPIWEHKNIFSVFGHPWVLINNVEKDRLHPISKKF
jgi:hypothetical protein